MGKHNDYIPYKDADILQFTKTFYGYALANYTRWGIPSPQVPLDSRLTAFEDAMGAFQLPNHGKVDTLAKNESREALTHALRTYIQGFIARNPSVTDGDKENMGLPLRDSTPTPHGPPEVKPVIEAAPTASGAHKVTAANPLAPNKEKPDYAAGVAFACHLRAPDEPPREAADMPSEYQTGKTKLFQYTEADFGKVADYAAAYENNTGKRGPWSNVVSIIVSG
jgi:hypothetical protein